MAYFIFRIPVFTITYRLKFFRKPIQVIQNFDYFLSIIQCKPFFTFLIKRSASITKVGWMNIGIINVI